MENKNKNTLSISNFAFQSYDKLRYADTDRQGHVNNAVFSTFLETGRVEFLYNSDQPLTDDGSSFVIAKLELQLLAEITWPGKVDIGTQVTKIGNSSLGLQQAVFQNDICVATADTVIVQMNDATRKSQPLSGGCRAFLKQYLSVDGQ